MLVVEKQALLPYNCEQLFALVNDIERYPEFLPWCHEVRVEQKEVDELIASVSLGKGKFFYQFKTLNRCVPHEHIHIELQEGPFSHLVGDWHFKPQKEGSQVTLVVQLDFIKKTHQLIAKPLLPALADRLVQAFSHRAKALYG